MQLYGIEIDLSRDSLITNFGHSLLKEHYLLPDEPSPQYAYARAAVAYCAGDLEFAQRIYDYVSWGWFMFSTPVLSNAPKPGEPWQGMPISCFLAGTPILQENTCINIEDIKVGDKVLTHKGRSREVLAVKKSLASNLYKLRVSTRGTPLYVTGNHLLLTNLGWTRVDKLHKQEHLIACDAFNSLTEKEYEINFPQIQTPSTEFKRHILNLPVKIDNDLAWALGFWFAEGSTSSTGTLKVTHGTEAPCTRWAQIMGSKFNIPFKTRANQTWFDGELNSKSLVDWFDNTFGKGCLTKTLPKWLVELPKEQLKYFYEGLYLGDGFKTSNHRAIELSNPKLVAGIHQILLKLNIDHTLQLRKQTRSLSTVKYNGIIVEKKESLSTSSKKINTPSRGIRFQDGLDYCSILELTPISGTHEVYDIQIEEDESFLAAGVVAHNCFLTHVQDNLESLINHTSELRWLSVKGGGVGGHWSDIRSVSKKSPGPIPFLKTVDADMTAYHQKGSRRGSYAAYLDVSHPDILEFLNIRVPTGGDPNRKCFNLHNAINITDEFMTAVMNDSMFNLVDPHTKQVKEQINARQLWHRILETRAKTGEPYLHFIDTSNRALPQPLKDAGLKINGSNLCIEIMQPTAPGYTSVCCLCSLVIEYYDEWKDTLLVRDLIRFLDNVLQVFIDNAPPELSSAIRGASSERSIGLGAMGFHSYLQKNGVPWESAMASMINHQISSHIQREAIASSEQLAIERGEYPLGKGSGRRNAHLLAIAPNANSSIIANTSSSIEPIKSNAYTHKTRVGSYLVKNKYLEKLLIEKGFTGQELEDLWTSIITHNGSVQHLDCFTEWEKKTFKTAFEIDQEWVVQHAADRQQYVCQGQSVNLFFPADIDRSYVNKVHLKAWKAGLKGLYYYRTSSTIQADKLGHKVQRQALKDYMQKEEDECMACHA